MSTLKHRIRLYLIQEHHISLNDSVDMAQDIYNLINKEISEDELEEITEENTHERYYYTEDEKGVEDFQIGFKAGFKTALDYVQR